MRARLLRGLHLDANVGAPVIGVLVWLFNQITSSRGDIEIEHLAALVSEAALRAIAVALRIRLQIRGVRKGLLHSSLDDRVARVVTDRGAASDVRHAARLEPQRSERRPQEAVVVPGIVAVRLTTAVPPAKLLALIR